MNKAQPDMNNYQHEHTAVPKGRKCDNDFKFSTAGQEKLKSDYSAYNHKSAKHSNLASAMDKPVPETAQVATTEPDNSSYYLGGRETKSTKQMFLASNDPATGKTSLRGYDAS